MKRRESHSSPSARGAVTRKKVSEQAADVLRQHLVERANVAFKFPPISELARQLGVSVVNAHRAVSALKDEGLVRVVHGKGVYSNLPIGQPIQTENGPAIGLLCYSETVALDFLRGRNAFYNIVMQGAFQEAAAAGYRVALHWLPENTAGNPSLWPDIERFGVKNRLSGLLMLCLTDRRLVRWIA
jgi:DNA-binding FadR family transcriptional regulator